MTTQYLARYAEAETVALGTLPASLRWHHALVTPAYDETPEFFASHTAPDRLLILVINRPDRDTTVDTSWDTILREILGAARWQAHHLSLHCAAQSGLAGDVLLIDRCLFGPAIPPKYGVGLARKIGCDIACQLFHNNRLHSPWIGSSDADARLPDCYGDTLASLPEAAAAAVFPFSHRADALPHTVVAAYELHMLYYVAGLRYAGSPYAWPTIGSCMAINVNAYQQARGFPKRAGGEDFYLLDKLAKLTGVIHLAQPIINIAGRPSQRVPFGTGPALQKIAALASPDEFTSYHPCSFSALKALHDALRLAANGSEFSLETLSEGYAIDSSLFRELWREFDCDTAITKALRNHSRVLQRQRALFTWFDAFKCLKWIHACRWKYPDIPLPQALKYANWLTSYGYHPLSETPVSDLQRSLADGVLRGPAYPTNQTPWN